MFPGKPSAPARGRVSQERASSKAVGALLSGSVNIKQDCRSGPCTVTLLCSLPGEVLCGRCHVLAGLVASERPGSMEPGPCAARPLFPAAEAPPGSEWCWPRPCPLPSSCLRMSELLGVVGPGAPPPAPAPSHPDSVTSVSFWGRTCAFGVYLTLLIASRGGFGLPQGEHYKCGAPVPPHPFPLWGAAFCGEQWVLGRSWPHLAGKSRVRNRSSLPSEACARAWAWSSHSSERRGARGAQPLSAPLPPWCSTQAVAPASMSPSS